MISLLSCLITALLVRLILESKWLRLPECKPVRDRWNSCTVCTCGGVVFMFCYLPALFFSSGRGSMLALGVASIGIWSMGLLDDIENMSPAKKFLWQVVASVGLVAFGWRLLWLDNFVLDTLLSIFWIVGLTNAFNLMDNMDGACTGVSLVILLFLSFIIPSPVVYALIGILSGFLIFNFPPAKLFMGDCGAYFLGLNLACLTMNMELGKTSVLLLLIPITDTTFVTIRRVLKGKSPARGGLDHISHELYKVKGVYFVLLVLYSVSILSGLVTLFIL